MTTPEHQHSPTLLKPANPVGIIGYGAYVPRYRLPAKEVARVWTGKSGGLPIKAGDDTVGAIGVSGSQGGAAVGSNDEMCGKAGIEKIADRLK